ncbi:unnamed protein product, partial [Cryptosporidium hominis]
TLEITTSILIDCLKEILEEIKQIRQKDGDELVICIEEWEDILHRYIPAIYLASKELTEVKSSIAFSDELSKVYLDFQRNEYMYTNLKISLLTLSCSITSVITGKSNFENINKKLISLTRNIRNESSQWN